MIKNNNEIYFRKSYSQDGEDVVLLSFFDHQTEYKGFYVDIGSLHPLRFSNTQLFYEIGWRGINIDATPGSISDFNIYRSEDTNLEIAISDKNIELPFYLFKESALNSFDKKLSEDRIKKGCELLDIRIIKTCPINDILKKYVQKDQVIDFMNIDIEGLELEVLKSIDWVNYKPRFLLVENLNQKNKDLLNLDSDELCLFLRNLGYVIVAKTFRTLVFRNDISTK